MPRPWTGEILFVIFLFIFIFVYIAYVSFYAFKYSQ